jgi:cytochrome c peroxidase
LLWQKQLYRKSSHAFNSAKSRTSRNNRKTTRRCADSLADETKSLAQKCWTTPEVLQNVNFGEMGNLKLTQRDIDDLVAFLETLTDGYGAKSPWFSSKN